ncbi:hypothetical protein U1Q18_032823, partial [Sarracenia purpurea var. burkii]
MDHSRVPNNENRDDVECIRDGVPGEVAEDDDQLPEIRSSFGLLVGVFLSEASLVILGVLLAWKV